MPFLETEALHGKGPTA